MKKIKVLFLNLVFVFSAILMVSCKQDPGKETPSPEPSPEPVPGETTTVVETLRSVIYTFKGVGISLETSEKGVIQNYAEENAPVQAQAMSLANTSSDKEDTGSGIPESVSAVDDLEGVSMVHTIKSQLDMYFAERKLLDEGTEFERLSPPGMVVSWYESFTELDEALKDAEENFRIEITGTLGENEVVTTYYRKEGDKYIVGYALNTAGSEFETYGKDQVYGYTEVEYYIDETGALIVKNNARFIVAEEFKDVIPEDYFVQGDQYYRILSTETSSTIEEYILWDGIDYKLMNMLTAVETEDFYYIQAYNIDMVDMLSAPGYLFNELVMSNPGLGETFTIEQRELIENEWIENCMNNGWHEGYPSIYLHGELAKDGDDGTFLFYRNFDDDEINLEVPENWLDLESFDVTTVLSSLEEINQPYMKHGELVAFNYENFITNDKK